MLTFKFSNLTQHDGLFSGLRWFIYYFMLPGAGRKTKVGGISKVVEQLRNDDVIIMLSTGHWISGE